MKITIHYSFVNQNSNASVSVFTDYFFKINKDKTTWLKAKESNKGEICGYMFRRIQKLYSECGDETE